MERTLRLIFRNEEGRNTTMSVSDPHDELNSVDVEFAMDLILSSDVFETSGGSIVGKVKAEVVSREVETILEF
ncbi:MAG: DUF2922 domain-containing protein [Firmicutes bacterium]|nr:DUF2922 domain-containing protein [Bacillota bacterium]